MLREEEECFRIMAKVAPVGIFRTDAQGNCTYVNECWCDLAGMSKTEALDEGWGRALHPRDRERVFSEWNQSITERTPFKSEYRFQRPDGEVIWLLGSAEEELDSEGRVVGYVGAITDITERKLAQAEIAQSETKFRAMFNSTRDAIVLIEDGHFIDCNPSILRMFGCRREDVIGRTPLDFSPPTQYDGSDSATGAKERVDAALAGEPQHFYWLHQRMDGTTFDTEVNLNEIVLDGKTIIQAIVRDISERYWLESAIRHIAAGVSAETGDAFFRHLVEHLSKIFDADYAFIGVQDKDNPQQINTLSVFAHGKIVDNMSYSLKGTPCANVMGQSTCAYPSGIQQQFPDDQLLVDMGVDSFIGTPLFDSHGKPLGILEVLDSKPIQRIEQVGKLLEIFAARAGGEIERMRVEEGLHETEKRLQLIHAQVPGVVFQFKIDTHGKRSLPYVNTTVGNYIGLSAETVMEDAEKWFALTHPDDYPGLEKSIAESLNSLNVWSWEGRFIRGDGKTVWLRGTATPERQEDGSTLWNGLFIDITEHQHAEEALRRSQKMEAIGQLTGGIAHDFNNQLGVIIGYLDFLKSYASNDEKPLRWVGNATKATQRCIDLTQKLLAFSRRQPKERSVVDINAILKEMETIIARSVTPEIEVDCFLADDLWKSEIDAGELEDVILNLVINARDAMPGSGKLIIESANKYLDADESALITGGNYVELMISDTGTGMDEKTLEHMFEPFFTTKPVGKGTGLGLAMTYGFVQRYHGHIRVYSEPGVGTTIRIYLPRSRSSESTVIAETSHESELPTGSETILIVDDEITLLELADHYLSDLGYHTYVADNAVQALKILEKEEKIDLLFSDVVMPGGMNGYELAKQATEQKPHLKVLLTSGFTSKTIVHNGLTRFSADLLSKPYRIDDLAKRIRHILDRDVNIS